jgi:hypothetical protein
VSAEPKAIPTNKKERSEYTTFMNMIRMVEYPTLKFSRIAAGMINTKAIQLQFLLNQALLSVKVKTRIRTIDINPHGNKRKVDGLEGVAIAISLGFKV